MKNSFFLMLVLAIVLQGCTRASNSESSKIQIKLPNQSSMLAAKTLSTNGGLSDPTTLDEVNCYGVFVGGPDDDLKNKTCALGKSSESFDNHSGGEMVFGDWKAAVPAGQTLSMDVKSGIDRVIYLVGMKTTEGGCVDFRTHGMPDKSKASGAFLLGIAGRLDLKAGAEVSVQIPMSLNSGKTIVGCRGDDLLNDGGDGGGSEIPYLRFEGIGSYDSVLDVDKATVGECYAFRPSLFKGQGGSWIDPGGNDIHVNVTNLGIGQIYSGVGCTSPVNEMVIPAGQSRSIPQYYFKATAASTATLENVVITGNSEQITGAQQKFDVGQRKVVINGPNRVVINECYPYKIISSRYEGGFLNTDSGGATAALTDNANFRLRTTSDCSSGVSASIAPYTSETVAYVKVLSTTTFNLGNYIAMSGYAVQHFALDSSARGDHYDALVARLRDDKFVRGECNDFNINLINNDGGAVKARIAIDVKLKTSQGAGVFYVGPNCTGGPVDSVQINPGDTNTAVSFKAHAIPFGMLTAGKLPIYIDSGSLKLNGIGAGTVSIAWVDIVDSNNNKVLLNPPHFSGAQIVGSHEFTSTGGVLDIPLLGNYSGLVDVQCSGTTGTGFSSCSGSEVDRSSIPFRYRWTASAAATNSQRFVRFAYAGYTTQDVGISSAYLYGPKFKLALCTAVAPVGSSPISAALSLNTPVLCLPANSALSKSSTAGYSLNSTRQSIVGHSSGTSVIDSNGYSGNVVDLVSVSMGEDRFIANLKIDGVVSSSAAIKLESVASSVLAKVYVDNVNLGSANASVRGIYILNSATDIDTYFVIRNSKIELSGTTSYGIYLENTSRVTMEDIDLAVLGSSSFGIKAYNTTSLSGDMLVLKNSLLKVQTGIAFGIYNSSSSAASNNDIRNSRFLRAGAGNGASEIVRVEGKWLNSKFDGNLVMAEAGAANLALMYFFENTTAMSFSMIGNTFVQPMTAPGIVFDGNTTASEFTKNSFAYTGLASNSVVGAVRVLTGVFAPYSSVSTDGGNIACGATSFSFTPFHVVASGSVGGSLVLGNIGVHSSNMVLSTGRCRGL